MAILQMPVRQIAWTVNSVARTSTCGARLFEVLDLEPEIRDRPDARDLRIRDGVVRFENVSFRYRRDANAPPVLRDVSFELRPGRVTGIARPARQRQVTIAHLLPPTTMSTPAASPSTARTCATSRWHRCAAASAWCSRTLSCSPPRSTAT